MWSTSWLSKSEAAKRDRDASVVGCVRYQDTLISLVFTFWSAARPHHATTAGYVSWPLYPKRRKDVVKILVKFQNAKRKQKKNDVDVCFGMCWYASVPCPKRDFCMQCMSMCKKRLKKVFVYDSLAVRQPSKNHHHSFAILHRTSCPFWSSE